MEFVLIGCVLRKRSVFIPYFTHPHIFNENKLRTHTLQARCGTLLFNENKLHTHTLQATCGTLLGNEYKLLTHTKQGAVLSRYTLTFSMRTNALLTRCKQRAVRYLAMRTNSVLTPCRDTTNGHTLQNFFLYLQGFREQSCQGFSPIDAFIVFPRQIVVAE